MTKNKWIIAGYGKYKYVKKVSNKRADELEEKGRKIYDSKEKAPMEMD